MGLSKGICPCSVLGKVASGLLPHPQANLRFCFFVEKELFFSKEEDLQGWARIEGASCNL